MTLIENVNDLRAWRRTAGKVLFVPTMGALHDGHATLVREARKLAGKEATVAVSIFVNPLQFGPNEDFDRYPRTLEADMALCEAAGADMVFAPPVKEVYYPDRSIQILEKSLSTVLCGASRPGHFDGVCTVVAKLFNLVQPDESVFGKKDYQQLAIIRRMVRDLDFPVTIHGVETVREADGLAMSSRNRYLSADERAQAPALRAALVKARDAWRGGVTGSSRLLSLIHEHLASAAPLGREDYVSLVDQQTLQPLELARPGSLIALAVFFDRARLIDNIELDK
ncbi:pantoate--beta-alanine ligase [Brevifollis gellanilyticus]|uniref:Pantothenate synthetase n=1 Tax=Brevifollis gellanilyticus TaxID=748831 RepID=A0A512M9D4_9BACT|nr:pantoate--beta-alanine ligase [Brevifollis gellanilyticus]GEP43358.1 pantothenate synthetase [Brevifollis gellanilyticus]